MKSWFQSRTMGLSVLAGMLATAMVIPCAARAQFISSERIGEHPSLLQQVRFDQQLNHSIPLNLTFTDEHGKRVELRQYFGTKPVIMTLNYYTCPMLCTQVLNGLDRTLENIQPSIGKDFNVVTVSIDPTDTPVLAATKQAVYMGMYNRPGSAEGWNFLVGQESEIKQLAAAVGFHYAYDPDSKQYAHAAGIMVLTPAGKLSSYLYGVQYRERDLRLALEQASGGKIGPPIDEALMYCYHYDPRNGKFDVLVSNVMKIAGGLTLVVGGAILILFFRGEH
ncbi:MAG: SCO family protein, partial [Acidobacteriota bacterium]|nr:SCO family protein [Acidobacteriota bacterium]